MKKIWDIFSRKRGERLSADESKKEKINLQERVKKEAAFHKVGERYGRAITRLSDT